ncbi:MAG: hypothetical protein IJY31_02810 [Muribaculaceae bacterium]|nr:hypothetical protein [Muribaculaceae bacterium]
MQKIFCQLKYYLKKKLQTPTVQSLPLQKTGAIFVTVRGDAQYAMDKVEFGEDMGFIKITYYAEVAEHQVNAVFAVVTE